MQRLIDVLSAYAMIGASYRHQKVRPTRAAAPSPPTQPVSATARLQVPHARMSIAEQWQRLTGIVEAAMAATTRARRAHEASRAQLLEAETALEAMLDELARVMPIPSPAMHRVAAQQAASPVVPILLAA